MIWKKFKDKDETNFIFWIEWTKKWVKEKRGRLSVEQVGDGQTTSFLTKLHLGLSVCCALVIFIHVQSLCLYSMHIYMYYYMSKCDFWNMKNHLN